MRVLRIPGRDQLWWSPGEAPVLGLHYGPVTPDRAAALNRLLAPMDDDHHIRQQSYSTDEVAIILRCSPRTIRRTRADYPDHVSWQMHGNRVRYYPADIERTRAFLARRLT